MRSLRPFSACAMWLTIIATSHAELVTLSIVPNSFPAPSSVSVFVDAGLLGDDEVESSLSGEITLDLQPSAINPTTAQISGLNGVVDDAIDFKVGGGFVLPTVTVEAGAGDVNVNMVEPGAAASIVDGKFSQLDNLMGFSGFVSTSVQDEPIDLAEQMPTPADFNDVAITADRLSLEIRADLVSQISIPFEVGIFSLNVEIDIEGTTVANGLIPAATYTLETTDNGVTGYDASELWLRGGVAGTNSLPVAIDHVELIGSPVGGQIDLGNVAREADSLSLSTGNLRLFNGKLQTNQLSIPESSNLTIDNMTELGLLSETASELAVIGGGGLRLDGAIVSKLAVQHGAIAGNGEVGQLTLGDQGRLELSTNDILKVQNDLAFSAGAVIDVTVESLDAGTFPLATAQSIDAASLVADNVLVNGTSGGLDLQHIDAGLFGQIELTETEINLVTSQTIPGDTDGNGTVDFADFLQLSAAFGMNGDWTNGDFDGNGSIEFADFLTLSARFGSTASPAVSIPEPSSLLLGLLGIVALTRLRSRV